MSNVILRIIVIVKKVIKVELMADIQIKMVQIKMMTYKSEGASPLLKSDRDKSGKSNLG